MDKIKKCWDAVVNSTFYKQCAKIIYCACSCFCKKSVDNQEQNNTPKPKSPKEAQELQQDNFPDDTSKPEIVEKKSSLAPYLSVSHGVSLNVSLNINSDPETSPMKSDTSQFSSTDVDGLKSTERKMEDDTLNKKLDLDEEMPDQNLSDHNLQDRFEEVQKQFEQDPSKMLPGQTDYNPHIEMLQEPKPRTVRTSSLKNLQILVNSGRGKLLSFDGQLFSGSGISMPKATEATLALGDNIEKQLPPRPASRQERRLY